MRNYLVFLWRCARIAFVGDWRYYAWMGVLTVFCLLGLNAYARQFAHGLVVTGMSDEVSWGVYIANFTFLVGVAAAAVMMVIPGLYLQQRGTARPGHLRGIAGRGGHPHVPGVCDGGPRAARPVLAPDPGHRPVQFSGLDAELGRDRAERLPPAERPHLRLPALLPLPVAGRRQSGFTSPLSSSPSSGRFRSIRSRRSSTSAWGAGRSGIRPSWARVSSPRPSPRAGVDYSGHAGGPPRHGLRPRRRCFAVAVSGASHSPRAARPPSATWTSWRASRRTGRGPAGGSPERFWPARWFWKRRRARSFCVRARRTRRLSSF